MLLEQLITEKLGNLSQLKIGRMADLLKQSFSYNSKGYERVGPIGKRFQGNDRRVGYWDFGIGPTSKIVDAGEIKNIADLRKAYRKHTDSDNYIMPRAFALYANGKAVAFGTFPSDKMSKQVQKDLFAFDLSQFEDKIEAEHKEAKANAKSQWQRDSIRKEPKTSRHTEKESRYDGPNFDRVEFEVEHAGKAFTVNQLEGFIKRVIDYNDGKPLTVKLVLSDVESRDRNRERQNQRTIDNGEVFTGLEALQKRLMKYKISKKPTASSIDEFLEMTKRNIKVVQFGGRGFATRPKSWDKIDPSTVVNGKPFQVSYDTVDPGRHDSINVSYVFDRDDGTLKPYKATWTDGDGHTVNATIDFKRAMRHDHKDADSKDGVLRTVLKMVKNNQLRDAEHFITAARRAGHDYPEFAAVEKSIAAAKAEKDS